MMNGTTGTTEVSRLKRIESAFPNTETGSVKVRTGAGVKLLFIGGNRV
jgi:hypothetical protein